MLLQGYWTVLGKDCMKLMTPQEETINVTRHGTLLYLTPSTVAYDTESMSTCERALDKYMNTLGVDFNSVDVPPTDPGTDAVEQLKTLINTTDREGQSLCQIGQTALLKWTDSLEPGSQRWILVKVG